MTSAPQKFDFETEFAADGSVLRGWDAEKKFYSPDEVEAEKALAYADGMMDESAKAERAAAEALQATAEQTKVLLGHLVQRSVELRQEAVGLGVAAAAKIAEHALTRFPEENVLAAVNDVMAMMRGDPRLVVRVAPELAETVTPMLEQMAEQVGHTGQVIVRPAPGASAAEVTLEWGDGVMGVSPDETAIKIQEAIERHMASAEILESQQMELFAQ